MEYDLLLYSDCISLPGYANDLALLLDEATTKQQADILGCSNTHTNTYTCVCVCVSVFLLMLYALSGLTRTETLHWPGQWHEEMEEEGSGCLGIEIEWLAQVSEWVCTHTGTQSEQYKVSNNQLSPCRYADCVNVRVFIFVGIQYLVVCTQYLHSQKKLTSYWNS